MAKKDEIVKQADANIQPYKLQQAISVLRGFPEDFMFRLTPQETSWMRSQIVTTYSQNVDNQQNKDFLMPEKRRADALPY